MEQQVQGAPQEMAVVVAVAHMGSCILPILSTATVMNHQSTLTLIPRVLLVMLEAQETQYQTHTLLPAMVVRVELEVTAINISEERGVKEEEVLQEQQVIQAPPGQRVLIVASH